MPSTSQVALAALALLVVLPDTGPAAEPAPRTDRKPNILFILADDQRFDTIRALGNEEIRTPNLDRLVRRGFAFTNAFCQGGLVPAVCAPSRAMLLTGKSLFHIPPLGAKT